MNFTSQTRLQTTFNLAHTFVCRELTNTKQTSTLQAQDMKGWLRTADTKYIGQALFEFDVEHTLPRKRSLKPISGWYFFFIFGVFCVLEINPTRWCGRNIYLQDRFQSCCRIGGGRVLSADPVTKTPSTSFLMCGIHCKYASKHA